MYTFYFYFFILKSAMCSPLSVRYSTIEMTVMITVVCMISVISWVPYRTFALGDDVASGQQNSDTDSS